MFAGLVAGAVMYGWILFSPLSGFVLLFIGASTGAIAYVLVIIAIGVEAEDREFFAEFVPWVGN
jgi:uncharacterized membrane protein